MLPTQISGELYYCELLDMQSHQLLAFSIKYSFSIINEHLFLLREFFCIM